MTPSETLYDLHFVAHWIPEIITEGTTVTDYGDHGIIAIWAPHEYTITYNLGGGTNNASNPAKYTIESATFSLQDPTKENCDFLGWTWSGQSNPTMNVTITKGTTGDKVYTANWGDPKTADYTVRHWQQDVSGNDYIVVTGDTQTLNGTIGAQTAAVAKAYTGFTAKPFSQATIASSGTVVDIYYDRVVNKVSFATGGGSSVADQDVRYGATVTKPTDPTKTGYSFSKWKNGNAAYDFSSAVTGSLSLTAEWTVVPYTISYALNGGSVSGTNPTSYNIESAAITLNNPTRTGYTVAGWTGTGLSGATANVTVPAGSTGDRAYTATWTSVTYTITYNLDGGSVGGANKTSYNIETTTFNLANPTKVGYTFAGWTGTGLEAATKSVSIANGSTGDRS